MQNKTAIRFWRQLTLVTLNFWNNCRGEIGSVLSSFYFAAARFLFYSRQEKTLLKIPEAVTSLLYPFLQSWLKTHWYSEVSLWDNQPGMRLMGLPHVWPPLSHSETSNYQAKEEKESYRVGPPCQAELFPHQSIRSHLLGWMKEFPFRWSTGRPQNQLFISYWATNQGQAGPWR